MRALALAIVVAAFATAPAIAGTPAEELTLARKAFREGQYEVALEKYNSLVRPTQQLASTEDIVEAYVNLGVCRVETGDEEGAKREFAQALELDPNRQLDTLVITNKKAIELFDDTKADIRTRKDREAAAQREAAEKERLRKLRASIIGVRRNPYALNFAPFGIGQIWYGQTWKGLGFAAAEAATAATSFGIWFSLVNQYGIRSDRVPLSDANRVLLLQRVEVATGLAFFGFYIWSVIDMHRNYKPQTRTEIDESMLPPELRDVEKKPPPKTKPVSLRERINIYPMLTPSGVGIGIGWENP